MSLYTQCEKCEGSYVVGTPCHHCAADAEEREIAGMRAKIEEQRKEIEGLKEQKKLLFDENGRLLAEKESGIWDANHPIHAQLAEKDEQIQRHVKASERATKEAIEDAARISTLEAQLAVVVVAADKIGAWLSAAMEDPTVCIDMKRDIEEWFEAIGPLYQGLVHDKR